MTTTSNCTTTGLDLSTYVGAIISEVTYEVPGDYGYPIGDSHESLASAIEAGIAHYDNLRALHGQVGGEVFLPERIVIDQRVRIVSCGGGSTTTTAQRLTFPTRKDAANRLALIAHVTHAGR